MGIEPHLESRPLPARRRRDLHHHSTKSGEREETREGEEKSHPIKCFLSLNAKSSHRADLRALRHRRKKIEFLEKEIRERLYSTCASPVVPHPSTGHAHGCLASEIGRDPAFPTRFDRTVSSPEVSLLTPSRHTIGRWKGTGCKNRIRREKREFSKELRGNRE